ncbi:MAG: hypothetical protein QNJ20_15845 [Paracoccaceae bacterium]|nr:hypothetical protein [Paracoccaceae bacterium]
MTREFSGLLVVLVLIGGFALFYPPLRYEPVAPLPPTPTEDEAASLLAHAQSERPDPKSVAFVGERRRRESETPDPTDILIAPETGIGLGWGWNEFHGEAIPTQCVEFVRAQPFDGQTSSLDFTEVNDQYELQAAMDMSASASVKTAGYEVEGEAKFSSETKVNGSALTYLIEAEVLNAPWVAQPPGDGGGTSVRLTDAAMRLAERDLELFKDVCGTGYISATYGGAKLSIVVEIKTFSQATRQAMSASVKGGGWGVKVSAAMSGSSAAKNEKATREIHFHQTGGKPAVLPTTPDAIIEAAETLAVQADQAEKIFRIAVTPYEVLRNWPREQNLTGSDLEYEELAALWGSYQALYEGLQDALDAPDDYVLPQRICTGDATCDVAFMPASNDLIETQIKSLQDEVIIWLDRLELAARACITAEEECDTNAALYRSPYAYQVAMPIRSCMFDQDFTEADEDAYDAAREEIYKVSFGEPVLKKSNGDQKDENRPFLEDFFPEVKLTCNGNALATALGDGATEIFAAMMIEDTAKGRCALGSLTPGCLDNAAIADWEDRIGQRSLILTSDDKVKTLMAAVAEDYGKEEPTLPSQCSGLKTPESWIKGDPGTPFKTTVWLPRACFDDVRDLAMRLDKTDAVADRQE